MLAEQEIIMLDAISIMQPQIFADLLDTESEAEKVDLEEKLIAKATELGVKTAFKE